ncbi:cytoglobin-2-like protein [Caerostris darwini]|uniref:Cytoglobin-2-like protein n=1 Tax=Caerostris darwini TaxID=1538125 RepID=A0AAV4QLB0_9ARAC|nr:cytoglobin-2-like protein [Caerostris darwini]
MLVCLFETHPDVQDVFMPFKVLTKDELRHSTELRAHGLRVMGFVQKVVARFEEPDKSEALLQELGKNHVMYGAKMDYVDVSTFYSPQYLKLSKLLILQNYSSCLIP